MKLKYFKIFLFFLCISCGYTNKEISQIVKEWQNKEIIFPYSLQSKIMGKDTACNYLLNKKYKILLYVDSTACTECKLQLYEWYKLIKESQKYTDSLSFIFVVQTPNPKKIDIICKKNKFDYPIFYDSKNNINKINNFPEQIEYQTFLLNQDNRVLIIGNPIKMKN